MRENNDDDSNNNEKQQRKKRWLQKEIKQICNNVHHFENSNHNHNTCSENKNSWPAKWQKFCLKCSHSLMLLLTTQVEIDNVQSQTDHRCSSAHIDDEHHHISQTSQSPFTIIELMSVAEYQKWLFQDFLKCMKIRDDIMYNLEFKLSSILKQLNLSINLKALHICSSRKRPAKAAISDEACTHFKMYLAALQSQIKCTSWTLKENTTLLKMRNESCSWEAIYVVLSHWSKEMFRCATLQSSKGSIAESDGVNHQHLIELVKTLYTVSAILLHLSWLRALGNMMSRVFWRQLQFDAWVEGSDKEYDETAAS